MKTKTETIRVTLPPKKEFEKRIKAIVTDDALYHKPTNLVVEGIWNLLMSLNENEEEKL